MRIHFHVLIACSLCCYAGFWGDPSPSSSWHRRRVMKYIVLLFFNRLLVKRKIVSVIFVHSWCFVLHLDMHFHFKCHEIHMQWFDKKTTCVCCKNIFVFMSISFCIIITWFANSTPFWSQLKAWFGSPCTLFCEQLI